MRGVILSVAIFLASATCANASEVIRFASGNAQLVGTFYPGAGVGTHPAIVILQGNGAVPRENRFSKELEQQFAAAGYGVFVFDKRGVGDSGGTFSAYTSVEHLADDGLAAIHALIGRPDVLTGAIGIYGHSQGGYVALEMAARSRDVAFVISVSGPGVTVNEQNIFTMEAELRRKGFSQPDIAEVYDYQRVLWTYYGTGLGKRAAQGLTDQLISRPWFQKLGFSAIVPDAASIPTNLHYETLAGTYDPALRAAKITVPVLSIFGAKDAVVPVAQSVRSLMLAYAAGNNENASFIVYPNAGHGIEPVAETYECHECNDMSKPWTTVPEFFPDMIAWLKGLPPRR